MILSEKIMDLRKKAGRRIGVLVLARSWGQAWGSPVVGDGSYWCSGVDFVRDADVKI